MTEFEQNMRFVCELASRLINHVGQFVSDGVTTDELNSICHEYTISELDAESAPLNYMGYPKSICTSVNNVVCHGIPNSTPLKNGDIVNIDVTVKKKIGEHYYYGDTSKMFLIGKVHPRRKFLCEVTKECLFRAIDAIKPGEPISVIGSVIEPLAKSAGFSVVRDFCGHGIGTEFHDEPKILHYKNNDSTIMTPGMIFTIEPMINERGSEVKILEDGWTAITRDGGCSAQWEHTILVTENGREILTS